jgi:hypothetical protein
LRARQYGSQEYITSWVFRTSNLMISKESEVYERAGSLLYLSSEADGTKDITHVYIVAHYDMDELNTAQECVLRARRDN